MNTYKFISNGENDTQNLAFNLAKILPKKAIIILSGDLGSGKTKFTEGFCKFYNLEDQLSSPTFNIVNEYINNDVNVYHFDVYRLEDSSEFYEIGGEEYFDKGICLIEWGEIIEDVFPSERIEIKFSRDLENENSRTLEIISYSKNLDEIIEKLKEIKI